MKINFPADDCILRAGRQGAYGIVVFQAFNGGVIDWRPFNGALPAGSTPKALVWLRQPGGPVVDRMWEGYDCPDVEAVIVAAIDEMAAFGEG